MDRIVGYVRNGVSLSDGTSVSLDASQSNAFLLTLTAAAINIRVLQTPTNPQSGQVIQVILRQGSGGSETIQWGDGNNGGTFSFGCLSTAVVPCSATAPTLSTTAGAVDILTFIYTGSNWLNISRSFNMTML